MTKKEIIDSLELYTTGRFKKDQVSITVEELQSLIDEIKVLEHNSASDAKLTVDTITELQNEITTQREVICNLNTMNDELQVKIDKIERIIHAPMGGKHEKYNKIVEILE